MCGIAGVLGSTWANSAQTLRAMGDALAHRGPDDAGAWIDPGFGIGLAHRRLAIVDLSTAGSQPMHSRDHRFSISFNGEIYNHVALRKELVAAGCHEWRGHSDTEVLLNAIEFWGIEGALRRSNGMFAVALWDKTEQELVLARDRTGEKPLYVGWIGGDIAFASELRALRCHPKWRHAIEPSALALMLRLGYVPAPWSIHPGVYKLPAASLLRLRIEDAATVLSVESFAERLQHYWNLEELVLDTRPWSGSEQEALDALQKSLDEAVGLRMVADVPVGALLSGGVDSSLVVASMQSQSAFSVRTFTVGFDDDAIDESSQARTTARLLGTDHQEIRLPSGSALDLVARLPDVYDEPFADAAQLPALLVCEAARRQVTVALTGDGGDELFHGYQRYLDAEKNWQTLGRLPPWGRRMSAPGLHTMARLAGRGQFAQMLRRQASRVPAANSDDYYARLLLFPDAIRVDGASWHRGKAIAWPKIPTALMGAGRRMRYLDQRLGLPEGIHTKLDRASMAVALELRVPMLDPHLLALAWRMPEDWLAHGGVGKLLLRRLLGRRLPEVSKRHKQGFDVPIASWLRGPLRPWAADLLSTARLPDEDLIDMAAVRRMLQDHVAGRADFGYALWSVLMFLAWNRRYG